MAVAAATLADLRRARRRRRIARIDPLEAVYRAYVVAVVGGLAVIFASGAVGDRRVGPAAAASVAAHGAPWIGLAVALVLAVGIRSGGKGGPLVIEAADVRHVLMSPVPRSVALRGPAARQLRSGAFAGAVVGGVIGVLAWRRLPGNPAAWICCAAAVGLLAVTGSLGAAMAVSGRRLGQRTASALAAVVVAWSAADIATGTVTSPMSALGSIALWPLRVTPLAAAATVLPLAAVALGLASVAGCSIEAAERRASLVGQLRFAGLVQQDMRTVTVLRRQLAQEHPRRRPWLDIGSAVAVGGRPARRVRTGPAWRRSWAGLLRFPAVRLCRLAALGAAAGIALVGAWRGTTALVIVAGVALHLAALDAVEPVAQEADHSDRADAYAVERGALALRLAGPPLLLVGAAAAVGVAAAVGITAGSALAAEVGAVTIVPAAALATGSALLSTVNGPPPLFSGTDSLMPPEMAGVKSILRALLPPALAIAGVLPVLAGRHPASGVGHVAAAATTLPELAVLAVLVGTWVLRRDRILGWWREAMAESRQRAGTTTRPPAG